MPTRKSPRRNRHPERNRRPFQGRRTTKRKNGRGCRSPRRKVLRKRAEADRAEDPSLARRRHSQGRPARRPKRPTRPLLAIRTRLRPSLRKRPRKRKTLLEHPLASGERQGGPRTPSQQRPLRGGRLSFGSREIPSRRRDRQDHRGRQRNRHRIRRSPRKKRDGKTG